MRPVERYVHHPQYGPVTVLSEVKGKHRDHCLCYNGCVHFKPGQPNNCHIAEAVFANCVKYGLVTPVYECPVYETLPGGDNGGKNKERDRSP